jgi:hypothetical protein
MKFLEVFGNELRPVVRDDPGLRVRVPLPGPLQDDFDVRLGHRLSSPMSFFSATCSAISSARTSSFVWIFFCRYAIRSWSAEWLVGRFCSKAAVRSRRIPSASDKRPSAEVPLHKHNFDMGSFSSKCRLRMATFSSGAYCFRCFFMRSLLYLTGRTPSPFPTEPEHRHCTSPFNR